MRSQREAVCTTILEVLSSRGVEFELNGETLMKDVLTPDDKAKVRETITQGFIDGTISITEDARAKHSANGFVSYTNGVVNNWIKKYPPFNNGMKYVPANPGSRRGQGDEQIKSLRALLKTPGLTAEQLAEINKAIESRLEEIAPKSTPAINTEALPEHLRHLVK